MYTIVLIVSIISIPPQIEKPIVPVVNKVLSCKVNREPIAPAPATPQQEAVIEKLGDSLFTEREKAFKLIRVDIYSYFSACQKGLRHKDGEIRYRCELLMDEYCRIEFDNISIWCLSNDLRFIQEGEDKVDIAKRYYEEAWRLQFPNGNIWYENPYAACLATELYIADLLSKGAKRSYVEDLIREMHYNRRFDNFDDGKETNYGIFPVLFGHGPPMRVVPPGPLVN